MARRIAVLLSYVAALSAAAAAATQPAEDALFAAIRVRPGATVCEIGAGDGRLTVAAARVVGASGRVFSSELGDARVGRLRDRISSSGVQNVTVVTGSATGTNFPDAACDAIFMRDVYHHFTDPAVMTAAIAKALNAGGRVAAIDFTPPPGSRAPTPADRGRDGTHGVRPEEMEAESRRPASPSPPPRSARAGSC